MLSQIVLTNNKILKEHFEGLLGENHTVNAKWGFPVTEIEVVQETDVLKAIFAITFDMMTDKYNLKTFSVKKIEQPLPEDAPEGAIPLIEEVADWLNIDSVTIDFFINRIKEISEQFFTTREAPKSEPVEEPKSEPVEEIIKEVK